MIRGTIQVIVQNGVVISVALCSITLTADGSRIDLAIIVVGLRTLNTHRTIYFHSKMRYTQTFSNNKLFTRVML